MRGGYRPNSGPQKGVKYKKKGDSPAPKVKKEGIPEDIISEAAAENLTPLEYMLRVMNDPTESKERRDRLAVAAAPFVHARKGEGEGKKEGKSDRAKEAAMGKFKAGRPPLALVK
jgi:phage terminase small subunit